MANVSLQHVQKVYDNGFVAVHDASYQINDGEFVVLVGPSGCGKSTTLRMVAGLETISSGDLKIDNKRVNDIPPKDRDIAMVFQNYALYPHMTVFENMAFGLKLRKMATSEIDTRVRDAAKTLGIESILDRRPKQLSGGQRQRVAVGRAIVRRPRVFLFDEPLSNLDAKLRVQMRTEIARLHQRLEATMLYVTHDQTEAMTMGDRIVILKDGHVQQIDAPLTVYNEPINKFVAGFIGSPAMNFIDATVVQEDGLHLQIVGANDHATRLPLQPMQASMLAPFAGRTVSVGIRPEHLQVASEPTATTLPAVLDVVEPMGNEMFLYAHAGTSDVVARFAPRALPAPGAPIHLALDVDRLYFFDPDTELRLRPTA